MNPLHSLLLDWFQSNDRQLPWRESKDPYRVWVSEIMLQQTQVTTVIPYFQRWMNRFPTLESLAKTQPEDVLGYWQGLGYYRRCKLLLQGVQQVANSGQFPQSVDEWLKVAGVGRYTAGAITSISQSIPAPIVDGNIIRIFSRLTDNGSPFDQLEKKAWNWASLNLNHKNPGDWNQSLMELGQLVCTAASPKCELCPISAHCKAFQRGTVALRPQKKERPNRKFLVWSIDVPIKQVENSQVLVGLKQAHANEWWSDLWVLPYRNADDKTSKEQSDDTFTLTSGENQIRFVVTKHHIQATFQRVLQDESADLVFFTQSELETLPIPAPFRKILNKVLK
jgi:A/G-specific adenine glycosylase